jgi:hypothetical protein
MNTNITTPSLAGGGQIRPIIPQDFEACWRLGNAIFTAGMGPKGMTGEQITIAIVHGLEVGLTPMAAVQSIAVVNGRPTIWGDGAIGLVRGSGKLESIKETITGEGDKMVATCTVKRKGEEPVSYSFSAAEAKTAGLWGKDIWGKYPKRMLAMRARAYVLRDTFADVLRGLAIREEVQDYDMKDVTPEPPKPPKPPAPPKVVDKTQAKEEPKDAEVEDVIDEPSVEELAAANEAAVNAIDAAAPVDSGAYFDQLEAEMTMATSLEELEEIWTARDPMATFEGNDVDQGIALSIKRRFTRRLEA